MANDFLGVGWQFCVRTDDNHKIAQSKNEEDIKQAIWIILSTSKGERRMLPDFGCSIHDYVFAPINTSTLSLIESTITEALLQWEPRIEVLNVETDTQKAHEGLLRISIDYEVRANNTQFNLVYPFYLKEGQ